MKRKFLHSLSSFRCMVLAAIMGCAMFTTVASAQGSASVAPPAPISTVDLQADWKAAPEYSAVLSAERASTALVLASPNTKEPNTSTYSGYDLMLSYAN